MKNKSKSLQYYFYRLGIFIPAILGWVYFNFLLLRSADNLFDAVPLVFQSYGMLFAGLLGGFIIAAALINRIGYQGSYRLAFFFHGLAFMWAFTNFENILDIYLAISVVRGFGSAFYWMATNTYMLREQSGVGRESSIGMIFSGQYTLEIVLPFIAGLLIEEFNYGFVFLLAGIICFLIVIFPTGKNNIPTGSFAWGEVMKLTERKGFKRLTITWLIHESISNLRVMIFAFVPFLLIGDELNTGIYLSAVGVVAAIITYLHRKDDDAHQARNGYFGSALVAVSTVVFGLVWTVPVLFIREIVARIGFSLYNPVQMNLETQVQELFVASFLKESAVEMAFFREITLLTARILNFILLMIVFYVIHVDIETTLRVIVVISAIRELYFLQGFRWLRKKLRIGGSALNLS